MSVGELKCVKMPKYKFSRHISRSIYEIFKQRLKHQLQFERKAYWHPILAFVDDLKIQMQISSQNLVVRKMHNEGMYVFDSI